MRYGSSNLTPNSIKNCNVACNRSEVSAQGVAPVAAETLVVVPCACSNKKDKRKQMYARVKECLLEDSCRSEWYSRQSYFSNWIISCTWASIVGSAWILCIPGQLWRFKYSPTSVGLGLWSPVPTILGANFRLCRHLTFSADSPPPPHVLDVLAGSLRTTRFIGSSRSVQLHHQALGGLKWLPYTASLQQIISISTPTLRC